MRFIDLYEKKCIVLIEDQKVFVLLEYLNAIQ